MAPSKPGLYMQRLYFFLECSLLYYNLKNQKDIILEIEERGNCKIFTGVFLIVGIKFHDKANIIKEANRPH